MVEQLFMQSQLHWSTLGDSGHTFLRCNYAKFETKTWPLWRLRSCVLKLSHETRYSRDIFFRFYWSCDFRRCRRRLTMGIANAAVWPRETPFSIQSAKPIFFGGDKSPIVCQRVAKPTSSAENSKIEILITSTDRETTIFLTISILLFSPNAAPTS